uniref:Uncharacterized protein n=1 Tax=Gopherus evgoodei TaxID=1825980 RepID=A0A8C4YCK4_9SAUR
MGSLVLVKKGYRYLGVSSSRTKACVLLNHVSDQLCHLYTKEINQSIIFSIGWGDEIEWVQTYEEALTRSRNSKKPLMVIHHLEECPYSQALKKAFVSSPEIQKMAQEDFIMLNLVHSSTDDNMAPDGHYVPRILFVDPSMTVRADLTGKYKNRMYAYEPEDISNCE